jgi:hypothetical protein
VAEIKSVHKFYWHILNYPTKPKVFIEKAETQMIDHPYSFGTGIAFRAPFTKKALVVGIWKGHLEEDYALTRAIGGRIIEDPVWDKIRYGE